MIRINLIPEEYRKKPPSSAPYFLIALALLGAVGFWIFSDSTKLRAKAKDLTEQLTVTEAKIVELESVQREMDKLRTQMQVLNDRAQVINDVALSRILWSRKLFEICYLLPDDIWLTKIEATILRKSARTVVRGAAPKAGAPAAAAAPVVQDDRVLNISGIVLSPSNEQGVSTVGTFMNNLSGLYGLRGMADPTVADQALIEQKRQIEKRNKMVRERWLEAEMGFWGEDKTRNPQDIFVAVMGKVLEAAGTEYGLTEDELRRIHASTSYGSDFYEADLVVIDDGEYLGKPVKEFTIRCSAKPKDSEPPAPAAAAAPAGAAAPVAAAPAAQPAQPPNPPAQAARPVKANK